MIVNVLFGVALGVGLIAVIYAIRGALWSARRPTGTTPAPRNGGTP